MTFGIPSCRPDLSGPSWLAGWLYLLRFAPFHLGCSFAHLTVPHGQGFHEAPACVISFALLSTWERGGSVEQIVWFHGFLAALKDLRTRKYMEQSKCPKELCGAHIFFFQLCSAHSGYACSCCYPLRSICFGFWNSRKDRRTFSCATPDLIGSAIASRGQPGWHILWNQIIYINIYINIYIFYKFKIMCYIYHTNRNMYIYIYVFYIHTDINKYIYIYI